MIPNLGIFLSYQAGVRGVYGGIRAGVMSDGILIFLYYDVSAMTSLTHVISNLYYDATMTLL